MDDHLRAGIAIYNAGGYHAAHDAWEDHWLELEDGSDDERFLHGLIQFTAAIYHGQVGNWAGLHGLAGSALDYLTGLPSPYRGVDLDPLRTYLDALAADPEHVERASPPAIRYEGRGLGLDDLDFEAATVAADVLAEEVEGYDETVVETAIEYARDSVSEGGDGPFVALLMDFVAGEERGLVYRRMAEHVDRRRRREEDVDELFDG